tara:strand:+ start:36 stop:1787 length:1752 start_codon:yes stop_codon:yes gene_type:complete
MADAAAMTRKAGEKILRLKIHVYGSHDKDGNKTSVINMLTTISPLSSLYHLKTRVEHQFQSLFPTAPPLVIRATQDKDNFLLPDELIVGTIMQQNDTVNMVAEGSVFQGLAPLQVASQRWDASRIITQCMQWESHTAAFFGANPFGSPPAVEVTKEVVAMLCDMVVSCREPIKRNSAAALRRMGPFLNAWTQLEDASMQNVCTACKRVTHEPTAENLAVFLQNLCRLPGKVPVKLASCGGREAAMALATGNNTPRAQEAAMELLSVLDKITHGEEHLQRDRPAARVVPRGLRAKQEHERDKRGENVPDSEQPTSLLKTLETILQADAEDASLYIADLLNRSSTSPLFLNYVESHDDAVRIFATIVHAHDCVGPACEAVSKVLTECCRTEKGRRYLCKRASFALLSELATSRDEIVRTHAIAAIAEVCKDDKLPHLPPEWLLALTRSPVVAAQRSASRALWLLACRDDDNLLSNFVTQLVALANADDPFIQTSAAKALGVLCVKEVNKKLIVRSGGPDVFINLLRAAKSDLEVQRFSAKALANLASTDKMTRIAVIRQVEERIPSWTEFDDSIVNVYLEMLFTN